MKLVLCPGADVQTVSWAWAGWLAGLRDRLVPSGLPLPASSLFQEGGW